MAEGVAKAAQGVLLAGAIVQLATATFVLWYSTGWHLTTLFWFFSIAGALGSTCAFTAYFQARRGHRNVAFGLGLVAPWSHPSRSSP